MNTSNTSSPSSALDFVAIGDIVNDEFIELDPAHARALSLPSLPVRQLAMNLGDKLPYRDATLVPAVGNSPNAAVCAHRLGLTSALVTDMGDDADGDRAWQQLTHEGIDMRFVERHAGYRTNHHYVLRLKAERTILIRHETYPYVLPDLGEPRWVYLSSVGAHGAHAYHEALVHYMHLHPTVRLTFQPGSYQIALGIRELESTYKHTYLFVCNVEEAMQLTSTSSRHIGTLLTRLHAVGPRVVAITDGPRGAYAFDGTDAWWMPPYPDPAPPVDRTGAGDAFAATLSSALALGYDLPTALQWAPINSMAVVQHVGAQAGLLTRAALLEYLAAAPAWFKPHPFSLSEANHPPIHTQ